MSPDPILRTVGEIEAGGEVQFSIGGVLTLLFLNSSGYRREEKQTKEESSRVKILVNSCISKMDIIGMRRSRKRGRGKGGGMQLASMSMS